jgi:putative CocE/NonD family hydrolase
MVRSLLSSLISASVVAGHKSYLSDYIVPQEVVARTDSFEDDKWDVMRDVFDRILRNRGWDEDALSSLPNMVVSHHNVTMRDGALINTLVVKNPLELKRRPAIVSRSPYGTLGSNAVALVFLVLNGYTAVIQDQRGTQKSTGVFDLWTNEGEDSTDVAEWISTQHWSNGEVYYCGGSADGMPGNMALTDDASRMKGEWQIWTAENGHGFIFPGGAYRQDLMEGYLTGMAGATHGSSRDDTIPKIESHEAYNDWYAQITLARDETDPSVKPFLYDKVNWPIIDSVGWWDLFQHTHLTHWKGIRAYSNESVRDQHVLVVGPLGHCIAQPFSLRLEVAEADGLVVAAETASEVFKGEFSGKMRSKIGRVNLFVMGNFHDETGLLSPGNYWTSLDDFPTPEPTKLFLGATGSLDSIPPTEANAATRQYVYDPSTEAGKTPMLGGNNLPDVGKVPGCGTRDQISKENRTDILIFDSEPLAADMPIAGDLSAQLFVSSSAKDTDFFVTVEDLAPNKQKSMLVRYGITRMRWRCGDEVECPALEAGEVYPIEIGLWATAYIFPKGHSIRVTVSSAAYPYYNANPNTGAPLYSDGGSVAATNDIHISSEYPSSVSLPVVAASDIPENKNWGPIIPDMVVV